MKGKNAAWWACPNKIVTFHSSAISEKEFVVGSNGWSKKEWSKEQREKSHKLGKPKHGRHKWQMKDKKKLIDNNVCNSAMASNLCQ